MSFLQYVFFFSSGYLWLYWMFCGSIYVELISKLHNKILWQPWVPVRKVLQSLFSSSHRHTESLCCSSHRPTDSLSLPSVFYREAGEGWCCQFKTVFPIFFSASFSDIKLKSSTGINDLIFVSYEGAFFSVDNCKIWCSYREDSRWIILVTHLSPPPKSNNSSSEFVLYF